MGAPRDTRDSQVSQAGPKFKAVPKRGNERIIREFLRRSGYFKKVKLFSHTSYLPGRVIGGGLVMVQLRGTLGLFSNEAIKLR